MHALFRPVQLRQAVPGACTHSCGRWHYAIAHWPPLPCIRSQQAGPIGQVVVRPRPVVVAAPAPCAAQPNMAVATSTDSFMVPRIGEGAVCR